MSRPPRTVLELCVARAGLLKGAKLAEFVCAWAIATRSVGHTLGIEEFSEWWAEGYSRRTAYNRLREFRAVFPEFETPHVLAAVIVKAMDARLGGPVAPAATLATELVDFRGVALA